jgi:hypothetical protein
MHNFTIQDVVMACNTFIRLFRILLQSLRNINTIPGSEDKDPRIREVRRTFIHKYEEDEEVQLDEGDEDEDPRMREVRSIFTYNSDEDEGP